MSWTTVPKPSAGSYTNVNPVGRQQYDQSDVTYDSSTTYYDSNNLMAWTNVATPSVAWNLSIATFNASYSVATQTVRPEYAYFSPDGVYCFVGNGTNPNANIMYQYTLSVPWDLSTKTFTRSQTFTGIHYIEGVFSTNDGMTFYILESVVAGDDNVHQYTLSTAWDISTATLLRSKPLTDDTANNGIYFKPDGTQMYIAGSSGNAIYAYNLSIPWNIATAVLNQSFSVASQTTDPDGIFFKSDGTRLYVSRTSLSFVYEYLLQEPWNIGTSVYNTSLSITTPASDVDLFSIFFNGDGLQLFAVTAATSAIREFIFPEQWTLVAKPT